MGIKIVMVSAAALVSIAAPVDAAVYTFDVDYSGGGVATLAAGSDNPLTTTLVAGDQFTYTLSAVGSGFWQTVSSGSIFPFFALNVTNFSTVNYSLSLMNDGSTVFTDAASGISNCCAHMGTNAVSFASGMTYDQYVLDVTILAGGASGPVASLLPYPNQGPEQYSPGYIAFTPGAVPEPSSWALMLVGFAGIGFAVRRSRQQAAAIA